MVCAFGDTHGGNNQGLINPEVKLLDPNTGTERYPTLTVSQEYLYPLYEKMKNNVLDFADGNDLYLLHLGDVTQGHKFMTELVSTRIADQMKIASSIFWPWLSYKKLKAIRLAIGTASHIFGESTSEELVTELLRVDAPKLDIKPIYHGLLNIKGALIDYAHHGPTTGSRAWLKGNEARYYLRSAMWEELSAGNTPPHLYFRGHYHSFVEEYLNIKFQGKRHRSWFYVLPSFCLLGEYGHRSTRSQFSVTNGMVATEVIDGQVGQKIILEQTLDLRTKEEI